MSTFSSRDGRRLLTVLICLCLVLIVLAQLCSWLVFEAFNIPLLIVTLLLSVVLLLVCRKYFIEQERLFEEAAARLERFAAGDAEARIDSDDEGALAVLFHSVNKLATTLSAAEQQAQREKLFMKDTISDISHQLKTPLAALDIYNSLLQEECNDPTAVREFSEKSEKELERIETLIQSLLKLTRLDSGAAVMELRRENLSDIVDDVCSHFTVRAQQEKKTLSISGTEDAELMCDRMWLTEAISNIVKNALDHTGEGGRIELRWTVLPSSVQLCISDNGSGIHPEDIYHIFKRFYRSRFSKDTRGVGLGLALVKSVVDAHGGIIEVDSEPGKGSRFIMNFPTAAAK